MEYTFDLVGVSPTLSFFNYQQEIQQHPTQGAQYLGTYQCTLDALIQSVETVPASRGWHLDAVIDTVINFWINNAELVGHWKQRLEDAGSGSLLVARLADLNSLKSEFESLFSDL